MFIVPIKGTKGVTVSKPLELMLKSAGGVSQVFFEDVRVPASSILGGEEGRGMSAALDTITTARLAMSARIVATCELAFLMTVDFVKNRDAFGQKVFDFQNTQFKLASVKTELAVARIYLDELLARNVEGKVDPVEASMAKLWISEMEGRVLDELLQLHGGAGSRTTTRFRRCMRSRGFTGSISAPPRFSASPLRVRYDPGALNRITPASAGGYDHAAGGHLRG